jgi:hypothetical protein
MNIRWQQKIQNTEVWRHVQTSKSILQRTVERKMNFFNHICQMDNSRVVKKAMLGSMKDLSRRGRLQREWMDDVAEPRDADMSKLIRRTQDRYEWRQTVHQAFDTNWW